MTKRWVPSRRSSALSELHRCRYIVDDQQVLVRVRSARADVSRFWRSAALVSAKVILDCLTDM